jgi:hypothetical protein
MARKIGADDPYRAIASAKSALQQGPDLILVNPLCWQGFAG